MPSIYCTMFRQTRTEHITSARFPRFFYVEEISAEKGRHFYGEFKWHCCILSTSVKNDMDEKIFKINTQLFMLNKQM